MVVLIYIFLHSSKYSINTVNKPSHNVSLFSASGIFAAVSRRRVSARSNLNGRKKERKKKKIQNLTSTLLTFRDNTKKYNTSNMKTSSRPWFKQWYWLENISWTFKIFLAEKDTNYKTYKLEKWK